MKIIAVALGLGALAGGLSVVKTFRRATEIHVIPREEEMKILQKPLHAAPALSGAGSREIPVEGVDGWHWNETRGAWMKRIQGD